MNMINPAILIYIILQTSTFTRSIETVDHWNSPKCQNFYSKSIMSETDNRSKLPRLLSREDFSTLGRHGASLKAPHFANEAVISDTYKFVYIVVRKAASSTMLSVLRQLGATTRSCIMRRNCTIFAEFRDERCTTLCLEPNAVRDYYFFTFVRNPISRFPSAIKQSLVMYGLRFTPDQLREQIPLIIRKALDVYAERNVSWDHHLESQAFSVGSPTSLSNSMQYRVPIDFIGKLETIGSDLLKLQSRIQNFTRIHIPLNMSALAHSVRNKSSKEVEMITKEASVPFHRRIFELNQQDFVCFGYSV